MSSYEYCCWLYKSASLYLYLNAGLIATIFEIYFKIAFLLLIHYKYFLTDFC